MQQCWFFHILQSPLWIFLVLRPHCVSSKIASHQIPFGLDKLLPQRLGIHLAGEPVVARILCNYLVRHSCFRYRRTQVPSRLKRDSDFTKKGRGNHRGGSSPFHNGARVGHYLGRDIYPVPIKDEERNVISWRESGRAWNGTLSRRACASR